MATRMAEAEEIAADARRIGWGVERGPDGWIIKPPGAGARVNVHLTPSDRNSQKVIQRQLDKYGFQTALAEFNAKEEAARAAALAADRAKADAAAQKVAKHAAAVNLAAGKYGRDQPTIAELLKPHPSPAVFRRVAVTPEMAAALLANTDKKNRKLRNSDVTDMVGAMRRGEWRYTHIGISLDTDADVQDGQHRLTSIVESGVTIEMDIAVGMPVANFSVIDTGRRRTAAQVLDMAGVPNSALVAAATRLLTIYNIWGTDTIVHGSDRVTNAELVATLDKLDPDALTDAAHKALNLRRDVKIGPAGVLAALYLIERVCASSERPADQKKYEAFYKALREGLDPETSALRPVFALRRLLVRAAQSIGNRRYSAVEVMALVLKTWNSEIDGLQVEQMVLRAGAQVAAPRLKPIAGAASIAAITDEVPVPAPRRGRRVAA